MALLLLRDQPGVPPFIRDQIQNAIQRLLSTLGTEAARTATEAATLPRR
jgi:hypothetical protein